MELISGNIFIRVPVEPMKAGEAVLGHAHNFDHTTVCLSGALEIVLLDVHEFDAFGRPTKSSEVERHIIRAGDKIPWMLILKGRWHAITALEDGSRYGCFYSHQYPQAINMMEPGNVPTPPTTKRDEDGTLWVRVNEDIAQDSQGWAAAYQ